MTDYPDRGFEPRPEVAALHDGHDLPPREIRRLPYRARRLRRLIVTTCRQAQSAPLFDRCWGEGTTADWRQLRDAETALLDATVCVYRNLDRQPLETHHPYGPDGPAEVKPRHPDQVVLDRANLAWERYRDLLVRASDFRYTGIAIRLRRGGRGKPLPRALVIALINRPVRQRYDSSAATVRRESVS